MSEKRGNWEKLSSKVVHKNSFYSVREDTVVKPNGSNGFYNVVDIKGSVFVVALDDDQNVYLVELHRYTNNVLSIEIPSGGIDGQDPLVAAKRELKEETGLTAMEWKDLGFVYPACGIICGKHYIFLATGLQQTLDNEQKDEGITRTIKAPIRTVLQMDNAGQITDSESIAVLAKVALYLGLISTN